MVMRLLLQVAFFLCIEDVEPMKIAALRWDRHSDDRIVHRLVPFLSADQQERYARLSQRADRHRMVIAEVLVRCQICRLTGRRNDEIAFIRNRYGKPYLAPDNSIYFHTSHSSSWIVTAIDRCDVGIDIERIRPMEPEEARILCTPREYRIAAGLDADARARFLHWLWTAKQSYLKARGTGRYGPLDELEILPGGVHPWRLPSVWHARGYVFTRIESLDAGYCVTACGVDSLIAPIEHWTLEQLLDRFQPYCSSMIRS
ncbi:4'-phosphopantetheinyl transferase superfamily protein [Paenibacillus dendritiformis]|nr:4'-phosphopantetheinyl transferase superfamily protein [Paenibacillus dendritiformis]